LKKVTGRDSPVKAAWGREGGMNKGGKTIELKEEGREGGREGGREWTYPAKSETMRVRTPGFCR
jgi:hypothetical protein